MPGFNGCARVVCIRPPRLEVGSRCSARALLDRNGPRRPLRDAHALGARGPARRAALHAVRALAHARAAQLEREAHGV
eukprot:6724506-Prymnesium_polylepis.1